MLKYKDSLKVYFENVNISFHHVKCLMIIIPFKLTAKNIQSMRALLSVAHCHGGILGSSWHLVLTTLQVSHVVSHQATMGPDKDCLFT